MIIEKSIMIAVGVVGVVVGVGWRALLYRREMMLRNQYGIVSHPSFTELVIHRLGKFLGGVLTIVGMATAGGFFLLNMDLVVEDAFFASALKLGGGTIAALSIGLIAAQVLKRKPGHKDKSYQHDRRDMAGGEHAEH